MGHLISRVVFSRSLNPIISHASGRKRLSTVLFGEQSPVVITGSSGKSQLPLAHPSHAYVHICAHPVARESLTASFAVLRRTVLCSDGNIDVYRLSHLEGGMLTDIEQATNLEHAIQKNLD